MMRTMLAALLLSPVVCAQTFIVDAQNGPGANFTSLAAAVAAAPSGSTLLVRPGTYAGFSFSGKALTILGGAGVDVTQQPGSWCIAVTNLAANQAVAIRGVRVVGCPSTVSVQNCAGPVLLEAVTAQSTCPFPPMARDQTFLIAHCAQVMVRNSQGFASSSSASHVALEDCTLLGSDAAFDLHTIHGPTPALRITGGSMQIADGSLIGGRGAGAVANAPGIALAGDLRVLGTTTIDAGDNAFAATAPAIDGAGTARLDPAVVLTSLGTAQVGAGIAVQTAPMPLVRAASGTPGGTLVGGALRPLGSASILLVGLPGLAVTVPGVQDPFWLDPSAFVFAAVGVPLPNAPLTATIALPANNAFLGQRLGWQSVALTAGGGLEASNPSLSLVR